MLESNFIDSVKNLKRLVKHRGRSIELLFNLTYSCPLRCKYCYVDYTYAPDMTFEQVDHVLEEVVVKNNAITKLITFFGGEPGQKVDIIEQVLDKYYNHPITSGNNLHFGIITSFTVNRDRLLALQRKYPLFEIVISWDYVNDQRVGKNGVAFEMNKFVDFEKLKENKNNLIFNKVMSGEEAELSESLIGLHEVFKNHGLLYNINLSKTPVKVNDNFSDEFLKYLYYLYGEFRNKRLNYIPKFVGMHYLHYTNWLKGDVLPGCGIGTEYFISSTGSVSPCSITNSQTKLNLIENGIVNNEIVESHMELEKNYFNNPTCEPCLLKGFCKGGCLADRWIKHKDYNKPNLEWCKMIGMVFAAYDTFVKRLSKEEKTEFEIFANHVMEQTYSYCQDTSVHTQMKDLIRK